MKPSREEICRMAEQAGFDVLTPSNHTEGTGGIWAHEDQNFLPEIERLVYLAVEAEREACERACDRVRLRYRQWAYKTGRFDLIDKANGAQDCIIEIRARGETK